MVDVPGQLKFRIESIKRSLLLLGGMVEDALQQALQAVHKRNPALAANVLAGDRRIDAKEVELEEECLATLTLEQPVAVDLRFVVAALKITADLERIGDLAGNIAEQATALSTQEALPIMPYDLPGMGRRAVAMLTKSLDALVHLDSDLAEEVRREDAMVDAIYRRMFDHIQSEIRRHPEYLSQLIHLMTIGRMLERIADHAVNISADVLYLTGGYICRHREAS